MMYLKSILIISILFIIVGKTLCLYEDQVGKLDWKKSFIGKVKFSDFDSHKRIVVATEENVIASLNLKNGMIVWRQIMENPKHHKIHLLNVDKEAVSVSGDGQNWYIRGWDLSSGIILWEWSFFHKSNMSSFFGISNHTLVHIAVKLFSHIEVSKYNLISGHNNGKTLKIATPWIKNLSYCVLSSLTWACLDGDQIKYINVLDEDKMFIYKLENANEIFGSTQILPFNYIEPAVLLLKNDISKVLIMNNESKLLPYEISSSVISPTNTEQNMLLHLSEMIQNKGKYQITYLDITSGEEIVFGIETNKEFWQPRILSAVCKGTSCRVLVQTVDNSLSILQLPSGKIVWTREEALSQILASEFVELPVPLLDASVENEFNKYTTNIFEMFRKRITSQFQQLSILIETNQNKDNSTLWRDDFGLHKLIVLVTKVGKIFVLDTLTGNIVWSKYIPNASPFTALDKQSAILFLLRTSRHYPYPPLCVVLMKNSETGNGIMYMFDPITGNSEGVQSLPLFIQQAIILPHENKEFIKPLVILYNDGSVNVIPESAVTDLYTQKQSLFMFTINSKTNVLSGLSFHHSTETEAKVTLKWNINFGSSKIISYGVRPSSEIVHSQGRVLGDRSVLYKYVNPNLIGLATVTDDSLHKNVHTIYLIDGVTGLIIYSACHKKSREPVHIVHSENWMVYSFFNERFRRTEVAAVELYEGSFQSNSSHFSSHAVSQLPHVETQAYILPANPLTATVTLTERGITSKHLLFSLSNGAVSQIPWMIMEPRGAFGPSGPEEGVIPYIPELPLPAEANINYNQSLLRVNGISVSPARLESTCLVLVHGLDIFYTRVAPSKTFDLLKEDFDHGLIIMVLVGLTVASLITKYLASRKAVKQLWK